MTYIKNFLDFFKISIGILAISIILIISLCFNLILMLSFYLNNKKNYYKEKISFLEKNKYTFIKNLISKIKYLKIKDFFEDFSVIFLYTSLVVFGSLSKFILLAIGVIIFIYILGLLNFISLSIGILICILYYRMYQVIKKNNDNGLGFFELYKWNKNDFNNIKDILLVLLVCMYFFIILTSNIFNHHINSIFSFLFVLNLIFAFIILNRPFEKNIKNIKN